MIESDRETEPAAALPLFLCSWCEMVFRNGERAVGHAENYGICASCLATALAALDQEPLARTA